MRNCKCKDTEPPFLNLRLSNLLSEKVGVKLKKRLAKSLSRLFDKFISPKIEGSDFSSEETRQKPRKPLWSFRPDEFPFLNRETRRLLARKLKGGISFFSLNKAFARSCFLLVSGCLLFLAPPRLKNVLKAPMKILAVSFLYWGGYIFRGKAPLSTIIPGYWGHCEDIALLFNSSYLSGKHALEGFSFWSFNEVLGSNLYANLLFKPLNPLNILGAFLVDRFKLSIYQVFGSINLLYSWLGGLGLYLYLKIVKNFAPNWAIYGVVLYQFLPFISYTMHFSNYSTIVSAFPWLLVASHAFARQTPFSFISLVLVVSLPLFAGMANMYANFFAMALAIVFFNILIAPTQARLFLTEKAMSAFILAVLMNSAVWGPVFIEMIRSKGQKYVVDHELSAINPMEFFLETASRLFPLETLEKSISLFPSSKHPPETLLALDNLGLLALFYGGFRTFFMSGFNLEHAWFIFLLSFGFAYFFVENRLNQKIKRFLNLMKVIKYQERIAFPFFVSFLLSGLMGFMDSGELNKLLSPKKFLLFIQSFAIVFRLVNDYFGPPPELSTRGFARTSFSQALSVPFAKLRRHVGRELRGGEKALHLLTSLISNTLLIWRPKVPSFPFISDAIIMIGFASAIGLFGKMGFSRFGGWTYQEEQFADDYFSPQKNEIMARECLIKDNLQFRALYFDNLETLQKIYPDDPRFKSPQVPIENLGSPFLFDTRKYVFHAAGQGMNIPDGISILPSLEKENFFSMNPQVFKAFPGMYDLAWNVINPFESFVPETLNVKYVISRYPLPGMLLLNISDDYWKYLYSYPSANQICRGVIETSPGINDSNTIVQSFRYGKDEIRIFSDSKSGGMVRLNMTLDRGWGLKINGIKTDWKSIDTVFAGFLVPPGKSYISLKYVYNSFSIFLGVSFFSCIAAFLKYRGK